MVKMLGARQYFCRYMIAYNWLNLVLVLVTIPLQASSQNGMTGGVALMGMVVLVLSLVWNWQIARHALEISKQYAVGITITNFMMKLVLGMMMTMHLFSGVQM
jgi:membrane-bound ClpP family serine protease